MKTRRKLKMLPLQPGETRKGRTILPDCSTTAADGEDEWLLRAKPLAKS